MLQYSAFKFLCTVSFDCISVFLFVLLTNICLIRASFFCVPFSYVPEVGVFTGPPTPLKLPTPHQTAPQNVVLKFRGAVAG